jgi:hypothetical protein
MTLNMEMEECRQLKSTGIRHWAMANTCARCSNELRVTVCLFTVFTLLLTYILFISGNLGISRKYKKQAAKLGNILKPQ